MKVRENAGLEQRIAALEQMPRDELSDRRRGR